MKLVEGASTLTQQLIKNTVLTRKKTKKKTRRGSLSLQNRERVVKRADTREIF